MGFVISLFSPVGSYYKYDVALPYSVSDKYVGLFTSVVCVSSLYAPLTNDMFFIISPQESRPSLYRGCINNFIAMLLVSVYRIILFHWIVVPLFSFWGFISMCAAFVVLALVFLHGLFQLLIGLPFFRSLLGRMFFLPYTYLVVAFYFFCCFCFSLLLLYFILYFFCIRSWRRCPSLPTFLSVFFCLLSLLLFSPNVFPD